MAGNFAHTATYQSGVYHFASEANKKKFEQAPAKYAPQYGGFCAVSTSMNMLEPGNVETWNVVDGKLYVQRNEKALGMWKQKSPQMFIGKADGNWPGLFKKYSSNITYKDVWEGQITLEAAMRMGDVALKYMKENRAPGGAVAIVDDAGMPVYIVRATGTFSSASDVSIQKARSAALFTFPTKNLEDGIYAGRNSLITANYNMMRGGIPIRYRGVVIGAVGVSGAASADQDVEIAEKTIGLR